MERCTRKVVALSTPYPASPMPTPHRPSEQQIRDRLEQIASDERHRRSVAWRAMGMLLLWPLLALGLMAWGLHTTDPALGPTIFQAGWLIGNVGILGTLLWLRQRS